MINMSVKYIPYLQNEIREKEGVIQDRIVSVSDFYNAQQDPRLHLDNVNWSYLDRKTGYELNLHCSLITEDMRPEPKKASIFSAEEFEYFTRNKVDMIFFKAINSILKSSKSLDELVYHELWHLIEKKNNMLCKDILYEGAAELASFMCTRRDWKTYIDSTMERYNKDELFNAAKDENVNVVRACNLLYIVPAKLLSKRCNSLSDILDEEKRAGAIMEFNETFANYLRKNRCNTRLHADIRPFLSITGKLR
jgi:hypothetical protein